VWIRVYFEFILFAKVYFIHILCECHCFCLILTWFWRGLDWSLVSFFRTNNFGLVWSSLGSSNRPFYIILSRCGIFICFELVLATHSNLVQPFSERNSFRLILTRFWWPTSWSFSLPFVIWPNHCFVFSLLSQSGGGYDIIGSNTWIRIVLGFILATHAYFVHTWGKAFDVPVEATWTNSSSFSGSLLFPDLSESHRFSFGWCSLHWSSHRLICSLLLHDRWSQSCVELLIIYLSAVSGLVLSPCDCFCLCERVSLITFHLIVFCSCPRRSSGCLFTLLACHFIMFS